jgi:putrescine:ornithine antiporter
MAKPAKKMDVKRLTIITAINMMGSGIILLPANLAQVGTISVLSWLVTTAGATCLAYAFARAGTYSNKGAGMGGYAEYAHGKSGSFMTNYTYFISLVIANVAIAVAVVGYGSNFFNVTLKPWPTALATIGVLWLASLLTLGGPRRTGNISAITIWGVVLPLVTLCIVGLFFFSPHLYTAAWNPHHYAFWHGLSASIAVTLWAFLGLESACANTGAVENPKKTVPIAVMAGTLIAAVLYIGSTEIIQGIVPGSQLANSTAPFGLAFAHMFNHTVGKVVVGMMVISCFGSLFTWQFTIAEVARSCAADGYFPRLFLRATKGGVLVFGIVSITIAQSLISLMTVSPTLDKKWTVLVDLSVMTNLIPYLLSMSALVALQVIEKVPRILARRANVVALLATVYSLYALYASGYTAMMWGGIFTFAGWGLYGFIVPRLRTSKEEAARQQAAAVGLATNGQPAAESPITVAA